MGRQIVLQPNGEFAIWSSVVDDFIYIDIADQNEIVEVFVEDFRKQTMLQVSRVVEALKSGGKPYFQFTKTFEECVKTVAENKGVDAESLQMLRESNVIT